MSARRNASTRTSGLSLVELLVAVGVLGVVIAVAVPSMMDLMERRRVAAVAGEIVSIFNYAKAEANVLPDPLTMNLQPHSAYSCIRVNTSAAYDSCRCNVDPANACKAGSAVMLREFLLPKTASVSFAASGTWTPTKPYTLVFERNRFSADVSNVKVTVTGARTGATLRVDYNAAGRVSLCVPNGSMTGYPACA